MMTHPVLFTHPHPNKVMIFGDEENSILPEVVKHEPITAIILINKNNSSINAANPKVTFYSSHSTDWIKKIASHSIDVIIHAAPPVPELLKTFFMLLHVDGILIQQSTSPFEITAVKSLADQLQFAGFNNQQILTFPQPGFSSGWRSIIMASKQGIFKRVREKAVYTRPFNTYYYNLDTHKASLALPEFMREEWTI